MENTRDYFAGLAMQAIVQDYLHTSPWENLEGKECILEEKECISEFAYEVADAMMEVRKARIKDGHAHREEECYECSTPDDSGTGA